MMDDMDGDEREVHSLFGALRRQVVRVSDGWRARLDHRLEQEEEPTRPVHHGRAASGALTEIINLLSRLMGGGRTPPAAPPPADAPAESETRTSEPKGE